jgi:hypothetical protein
MHSTTNVLVVANLTAGSPELVGTLVARGECRPAAFTLLVPASSDTGGWDAARDRLDEAVTDLRCAGLSAGGRIGCGDPVLAVFDEWDSERYDEVILCTLPANASGWIEAEVPERVERLTGARVTHVVSEFAVPGAELAPPEVLFDGDVPSLPYGMVARQPVLAGAGRA